MTGTCDPLKMFSFSVKQPSLCFSNVGILVIPKLCMRLVVGIARIPTLEKQSEGCMTEKLNILRGSQVPVMHLLLQTTSRQLVITIIVIII